MTLKFGDVKLKKHNKTLVSVLQRAEEFGITFNKRQISIRGRGTGVLWLPIYKGRLEAFSRQGRCVKDSHTTTTKEAIRSFFGMVGYLSRLIERFSSITAPLQKLSEKDIKCKWGPDEQRAFGTLKDSLTSENTMIYFNLNEQ